ncbi:CPCC family cysteine-rich protein [Herpetosiphon sp. NSE202]|uniref:CPCC family cysteine-rich protein n=1 Tax=Herpetosiphon sp. NSE202 TaxID=3351349 RepID=UPI00362BF816
MSLNKPIRYPCPCCGYKTVEDPGRYDLCEVCWWEDDEQQSDNPDLRGGANAESLNEARQNFKAYGAISLSSKAYVRKPHPDEYPD